MSEEELRASPRLTSHAGGVMLGVTHIITGLENPVTGDSRVGCISAFGDVNGATDSLLSSIHEQI